MKAKKILVFSLVSGLLAATSATESGAKPALLGKKQKPENIQHVPLKSTPELVAADQRVKDAKVHLDTAHKQLEAAKALLRAAEADFRAARAEREALALRLQAQGLADASGLKQQIAARSSFHPTSDEPENAPEPGLR